jgi:hypothetical protein
MILLFFIALYLISSSLDTKKNFIIKRFKGRVVTIHFSDDFITGTVFRPVKGGYKVIGCIVPDQHIPIDYVSNQIDRCKTYSDLMKVLHKYFQYERIKTPEITTQKKFNSFLRLNGAL